MGGESVLADSGQAGEVAGGAGRVSADESAMLL